MINIGRKKTKHTDEDNTIVRMTVDSAEVAKKNKFKGMYYYVNSEDKYVLVDLRKQRKEYIYENFEQLSKAVNN